MSKWDEVTVESCLQQNKRYRGPQYVPGGCVLNKENSVTSQTDGRCPQGMHWHKTFLKAPTCVKPRKQNAQPAQKPAYQHTCTQEQTSALFDSHIRAVKEYLREYFTVPDAYSRWRYSELNKKLIHRVARLMQNQLKIHGCKVVLTAAQGQALTTAIREEVWATQYQQVSEENWQTIKEYAKLDMLLFACRSLTKLSTEYSYTSKYKVAIERFRNALLKFRDEHLLPRQNLAVQAAYFRYVNQFVFLADVPDFVRLQPVNAATQKQNMVNMKRYAVQHGYMKTEKEDNVYLTSPLQPIPEFLIPTSVLDDGSNVVFPEQTFFTPGPPPPPPTSSEEESEEAAAAAIYSPPSSSPSSSSPSAPPASSPAPPTTPASPALLPDLPSRMPVVPSGGSRQNELDDLAKLYFVFTFHDGEAGNLRPALTRYGQQLQATYRQRLLNYETRNHLTEEEAKQNLQEYNDNRAVPLQLQRVGANVYNNTQVMFPCPSCNQILTLRKTPNLIQTFPCPNCSAPVTVNFPNNTAE